MMIFKRFLLITLLLSYTAAKTAHAQDDGIIPESEGTPASSIPQINNNTPTPPVIIDESDSSGVSDSDDYDN
jgi:hypothetical protein